MVRETENVYKNPCNICHHTAIKADLEEEEVQVEEKRPRRAKRPQLPPDELGPMWAPYQTRMVTQKGQVISTPKLILL